MSFHDSVQVGCRKINMLDDLNIIYQHECMKWMFIRMILVGIEFKWHFVNKNTESSHLKKIFS